MPKGADQKQVPAVPAIENVPDVRSPIGTRSETEGGQCLRTAVRACFPLRRTSTVHLILPDFEPTVDNQGYPDTTAARDRGRAGCPAGIRAFVGQRER